MLFAKVEDMPVVNQREFFKRVDKDIENLYLIYGEERYLVDHSVKLIISKALGGNKPDEENQSTGYSDVVPNDFNLDIFSKDAKKEDVISALGTLPMMSHNRVVVIKDVDSCKYLDDLKDFIENPNPTTVVIFVSHKIDLRKKFFKTLVSKACAIEFSYLKEDRLADWIAKKLKACQKVADRKTCLKLVDLVGCNMLNLHSEMMKLVNYVGDREVISKEDVIKLTPKLTLENVFSLSRCLASGNKKEALRLFTTLMSEDSNLLGMLALIARHFRILLIVKKVGDVGVKKISSMVGVPHYFVGQYVKDSDMWSMQNLEAMHSVILQTDKHLKSSSVPDHIHFTSLILKGLSLRGR